jgi:hypothetical protein
MFPHSGLEAIRPAAVALPVVLIIIFLGLLWMLGLGCGKERRKYVTELSKKACNTIAILYGSAPQPDEPGRLSVRP